MASKIQYLLCEALRSSIEWEQKDETLLPRVMTVMETDFLDYVKLRASHSKNLRAKMVELFNAISTGTLTPEQCRKWIMVHHTES